MGQRPPISYQPAPAFPEFYGDSTAHLGGEPATDAPGGSYPPSTRGGTAPAASPSFPSAADP